MAHSPHNRATHQGTRRELVNLHYEPTRGGRQTKPHHTSEPVNQTQEPFTNSSNSAARHRRRHITMRAQRTSTRPEAFSTPKKVSTALALRFARSRVPDVTVTCTSFPLSARQPKHCVARLGRFAHDPEALATSAESNAPPPSPHFRKGRVLWVGAAAERLDLALLQPPFPADSTA